MAKENNVALDNTHILYLAGPGCSGSCMGGCLGLGMLLCVCVSPLNWASDGGSQAVRHIREELPLSWAEQRKGKSVLEGVLGWGF